MTDHLKTIRSDLVGLHGIVGDFSQSLAALDALEQAMREPVMREPVMWQRRMRPTWGHGNAPWGAWVECSEGSAKDCWKTPLLHDWAYEARALYEAAPPAQQAQPNEWYGALEFAARHLSSDWPEECQQMVRKARKALRDCPAQQEQDK